MPSPAASLTLREMIGQMLLVGFRGSRLPECGPILSDIHELGIGSVILFDKDMAGGTVDTALVGRNIETPPQLRELISGLQAESRIPLLVAIDQEGGRVNRLKAEYGFPDTLSHEELGRRDEPAATFEHAALIAETLASAGINLNLAPVVDLDANPDNPIIKGKGRSFSADPDRVARHAAEFASAHRARHVLTCAKHFPGHGSAAGDTHLGLVDVTRTWNERELIPFQRLIEAGLADMVMTAHVFNSTLDANVPATLSKPILTGLLRQTLGFKGVVASDDMEMRAISSRYGLDAAVAGAINAGVDLLCFGNNLTYNPDIAHIASDIIASAVESGRIPESRIEESCARILALKRKIGLIP